MTLWHIDDFKDLAEQVPKPWPWTVIGVMPTQDDYQQHGDVVYGPEWAFCYTVSTGPTELWCPMSSIEGEFCPAELITGVVNVLFTAVGANQIDGGDNVIVPFYYAVPHTNGETERRDSVFWVGTPTEDPDHSRFHCYQSPNRWVLPVRWSSPNGLPE
jgi:hypothetical protein